MYKISFYYFSTILFFFVLTSCKNKTDDPKTIVQIWNGKEVKIPASLDFKSLGNDTSSSNILKHRYKVLVYLDSNGCIACRLNLPIWKTYIDSCQQNHINVGFLFVVQSVDYKIFEQKLKNYNFTYPIIYDRYDLWNKLNDFPEDEEFRTFLLNENNHIILIGNPINNKKIRKLYDSVLTSRKSGNLKFKKKTDVNMPLLKKTTLKLNTDFVDLGKFSYKTIKRTSFKLLNTGTQSLIIQSVNTSCGCTVAKFDNEPVAKGKTATVILEFKPISTGYFRKTADVVCNARNGFVHLTISGEVVEK